LNKEILNRSFLPPHLPNRYETTKKTLCLFPTRPTKLKLLLIVKDKHEIKTTNNSSTPSDEYARDDVPRADNDLVLPDRGRDYNAADLVADRDAIARADVALVGRYNRDGDYIDKE
jgi:hypothetical protein